MVRESIQATAAAALDRRLQRLGTEYMTAELPDSRAFRWSGKAWTSIEAHQASLAAGTAHKSGLVFIGPTGIGKTLAAAAICRQVGTYDPSGVAAMSESELLDPHVPPWDLLTHIDRIIRGRRCVFIDDVGAVSRNSDQVMSGWKYLADLVHAATHPVLFVATTNRQSWKARGGLQEWIGAQAVSRLQSFTDPVTTGFCDHRTGDVHVEWQAALTPAADGASHVSR